MADALVNAATEEILKKLVSFINEEINLAWGLKGDLKKLKKKLIMIQAVFHDAERRQVGEESLRLRVWLKNLRSVAYDAEDVFDEFAFEILRRKLEIQNRMRNKVRNFFSVSNPIAFRFKMAHKVQNINSMLAQVIKEAGDFGIWVRGPVDTMVTSHGDKTIYHGKELITHPFVDKSKLVGRDDDAAKIVDMLFNSESNEDLSIIAIVGMAGLGKTTLAQLVFNNEVVKRHFSERSWVCVSDDFDVQRLLKETLESIGGGSCEVSNMKAIIQKLKEKLNGKQCLLVLDDLWNKDAEKWERMRNSLLGIRMRGSKIMVTTRSDEVVSTMQTILTYRLNELSNDDSWNLFKQKAFASGGAKETPNLVNVGRRIVKKCRGVPLAIKSLGALMYSKEEEHEWLSIQNSEIWDLPEDENGILPALRLSFEHLQSLYLKQCFTYCAIFPKDSIIEKEDLIQLWMAQGFLQASKARNSEVEDIGHIYFKTLLWNSFFQDVETDMYGNITTCKMHDLVHDLAQSMSGSQCLTFNMGDVNDDFEAQHLSLISNGEILSTIPRERVRKMRTLMLRGNVLGNSLLNLKFLRVLNLDGANIVELPTSIGKLKHLRYLNVSRTTIVAFPKSICKLYNLQTLRFLNCRLLKEFPDSLKYLIGLKHLYFDGRLKSLPIGIGQLTCLQTLPFFHVGEEGGCQIEELGSLNKLRGKLNICNLERVKDKEEAKKTNLLEKTSIFKLGFEWSSEREGGNINDEDVLEGLEPQPNIKGLTIENFGGNKFPSWMLMRTSINSSSGLFVGGNLVKIKLIDCEKCEQIPPLGRLPFLRFLKISGMKNVDRIGIEFYGYGNSNNGENGDETRDLFPKLEIFILASMDKLVEWTATAVDEVVFPCLETLYLFDCPQLTTAPTHFPSLKKLGIGGIHSSIPLANISSNLTTLTDLHIENVSELCFVPEGLLQNSHNLSFLEIRNCHTLTCIAPHLSACCTSLQSLIIWRCEKLSYLADGLHTLVSLETLIINDCDNLESIPSISGLTSLQYLSIRDCAKLKCLPEDIHCLTRLTSLGIGGFWKELDSFPNFEDNLQLHLASLRHIQLSGWPKLKSLPHQLQHLSALTSLDISTFDGVEALPEWLGSLSSLQYVYISDCTNLMYLPSAEAMQRLTNLQYLRISNCPLLKERCAKGSGPEWFKISHITTISI